MRVKYIYLAVCIIVGRALPCTSKVSCQVHKTTTFYYCRGYRKVGATYWSLKCIQYFKKCPAQGILQLSSCGYKVNTGLLRKGGCSQEGYSALGKKCLSLMAKGNCGCCKSKAKDKAFCPREENFPCLFLCNHL